MSVGQTHSDSDSFLLLFSEFHKAISVLPEILGKIASIIASLFFVAKFVSIPYLPAISSKISLSVFAAVFTPCLVANSSNVATASTSLKSFLVPVIVLVDVVGVVGVVGVVDVVFAAVLLEFLKYPSGSLKYLAQSVTGSGVSGFILGYLLKKSSHPALD